MSNVAIHIEHLGKRYRIDGRREGYRMLRDSISRAVAAPMRLIGRLFGAKTPEAAAPYTLWALRDVTFDVPHGEVMGIIGQNGAGKSTLLKILSRITEPTEGYADVEGRVGSLLEVGTGFHAELTGRENLYLNGAILGMKRAEINRKFDEIVAFAEVERFIDTPVKHFSTGMYLRLAFAVAAHLEPEILIVDEVLAVGDASFQRKCIGKMSEVAGEGRTVLFVSHNMGAILRLCKSAVLLHQGRVVTMGDAQSVVQHYLNAGVALAGEVRFDPDSTPPARRADLAFTYLRLRDGEGRISASVTLSGGVHIEIGYRVTAPLRNAGVAIRLWNSEGVCVLTSNDLDDLSRFDLVRQPGEYSARLHIPCDYLRAGSYWLDLTSTLPGNRVLDERPQCIGFEVVDDSSSAAQLGQTRLGIVAPVLRWEVGPREDYSKF